MEVNFNGTNKEIFGTQIMYNVQKHGLMSEEIFSDKGKTADNGTLAKRLYLTWCDSPGSQPLRVLLMQPIVSTEYHMPLAQ